MHELIAARTGWPDAGAVMPPRHAFAEIERKSPCKMLILANYWHFAHSAKEIGQSRPEKRAQTRRAA
ncbi:MAG: hypothetical protein CVT82_11005 [Alphaproteobacteria bacterium HGW-Alphaproteobacteria-4]|nr:MAG: hypothetical protein CVT82_11005 [Alphaproteobacteria bacterium HGW-Alphaproteobacteria-4]